MSRFESEYLQFDFEPNDVADQLGDAGIGAVAIDNALTDKAKIDLNPEIDQLNWRDAHTSYQNKRGMTIHQNHDVFALDLVGGDQSVVISKPAMRHLASDLGFCINSLAGEFPVLSDWEPTEMSCHRYDQGAQDGLSFHKDNSCFWGVIGIVTVRGSSEFHIGEDIDNKVESVRSFDAREGTLMLMRAADLFEGCDFDKLPNHAVLNVASGEPRVSFMLRANKTPERVIPGFSFENH